MLQITEFLFKLFLHKTDAQKMPQIISIVLAIDEGILPILSMVERFIIIERASLVSMMKVIEYI